MWAVGVVELGLEPDVFWNLTPKLFNTLCRQFAQRERRADRRSGEIVAMLYNLKRDSNLDPQGMSWEDIYPDGTEQESQTDEEMFLAMQAFAKRSKGRD